MKKILLTIMSLFSVYCSAALHIPIQRRSLEFCTQIIHDVNSVIDQMIIDIDDFNAVMGSINAIPNALIVIGNLESQLPIDSEIKLKKRTQGMRKRLYGLQLKLVKKLSRNTLALEQQAQTYDEMAADQKAFIVNSYHFLAGIYNACIVVPIAIPARVAAVLATTHGRLLNVQQIIQ